jgi:hypothetical protein
MGFTLVWDCSAEASSFSMEALMPKSIVHSDPEILGGTLSSWVRVCRCEICLTTPNAATVSTSSRRIPHGFQRAGDRGSRERSRGLERRCACCSMSNCASSGQGDRWTRCPHSSTVRLGRFEEWRAAASGRCRRFRSFGHRGSQSPFQQNLFQARLGIVLLIAPAMLLRIFLPLVPSLLATISKASAGQLLRVEL